MALVAQLRRLLCFVSTAAVATTLAIWNAREVPQYRDFDAITFLGGYLKSGTSDFMATLSTSTTPEDLQTQMEIPRQSFIIWKSPDLPKEALLFHNYWMKMEPNLTRRIVTDDECRSLAERYRCTRPHLKGGHCLVEPYDSFPLNVMRADTCRLLVIYFYGGIYMDLDVHWMRPIEDWFNFSASSGILFGNETRRGYPNPGYCNWFFGARRGHRCIAITLDEIVERYRSVGGIINVSYEHFVHDHTGPNIFTVGMKKCGVEPVYSRADLIRINIWHAHGSVAWNRTDSWTAAREELWKK
mmetsp:Transcript_32999/g.72379  ORF Transcript_32999/g.72379 Transcript_32999/m.72379 type:complete len:299 (+) Transcript_32999:165-1061(+)